MIIFCSPEDNPETLKKLIPTSSAISTFICCPYTNSPLNSICYEWSKNQCEKVFLYDYEDIRTNNLLDILQIIAISYPYDHILEGEHLPDEMDFCKYLLPIHLRFNSALEASEKNVDFSLLRKGNYFEGFSNMVTLPMEIQISIFKNIFPQAMHFLERSSTHKTPLRFHSAPASSLKRSK